MSTQEFTYEEMLAAQAKETGAVRQQWFKHKTKNVYKYQLDIFGELRDYEKVEL